MAFSEITGTQALTSTEHSMATDTSYDTGDAQTTEAILQVFLSSIGSGDLPILGDVLRVRIYDKVRSGDTQTIVDEFHPDALMTATRGWVSPAYHVHHGWDATLTAVAGGFTINWSLRLVT